MLNTALAWTHYRALLKVSRREARDFYEIEAVKNGWSARQLERQIASLLFERLVKSRDKAGLLALASEGLEPTQPADLIKDPYVLEFLGLPESPRLHETRLEEALIAQLQSFLLELGSGFAFALGAGDNPTIGLILCTEKNDAVVRYVLADKSRQIFASRYQLVLPTEAELQDELKRELARVANNEPGEGQD